MRLLHVQKAAHYSGLAGRMLFFVVAAVRTPNIAENNSHGHRSMPMTQRQEEERISILEGYFHTNISRNW